MTTRWTRMSERTSVMRCVSGRTGGVRGTTSPSLGWIRRMRPSFASRWLTSMSKGSAGSWPTITRYVSASTTTTDTSLLNHKAAFWNICVLFEGVVLLFLVPMPVAKQQSPAGAPPPPAPGCADGSVLECSNNAGGPGSSPGPCTITPSEPPEGTANGFCRLHYRLLKLIKTATSVHSFL